MTDPEPSGPASTAVLDDVRSSLPHEAAPDEVDVFQAFNRVLHLHRQMMLRALGAEGTHPGQAACLRTLVRHDGIAQRELAERLHVSPPTITTMVQRMERSGMVMRRVDPADQRMTRVHISAEGRRLEAGLRDVLAATMHRVLGPMAADDRRDLARLLEEMADNMTRALE